MNVAIDHTAIADVEIQAVQQQLLRWKSDPVAFVKEALRATPDTWQEEALNNIANNDKLAVKSGHGVGKSSFLSWVSLWWLTTRYPSKIAVTAPTAHQLHDVLASEIRLWLRRMPPLLADQYTLKSDRIELTDGKGKAESFLVFRTARKENPEALQGFHSQHMLFLIDEASGVEEVIFEVARGALSTPGAKVVMTGNPTRTSGYFFNAFKPDSLYNTMTVSCKDSALVSEEFINDMAAQYGADSNVFKVRVLGEFPSEDDDTLIPYENVVSACGREISPEGMRPVWGVDCARYGNDDSVLIKRAENVVTEPPVVISQRSTMEVTGFVKNEWEKTIPSQRPDVIYVDSIGIGAGVVDRLREQGIPAVGINVAEQPRAMLGEANRLRDELWLKCAKWFEAKDVALPALETGGSMDKKPIARLVGELTGIKKGFTSAGRIRVESKDDMKKRTRRSPDVADALVLTFADEAAAILGAGAKQYLNWNKPIRRNLEGIV